MKLKPIFGILLALIALPLWIFCVWEFETLRLFTLLLPPILVVNFSRNLKVRNATISIFVVFWLFIFHYESTRYFYRHEAFAQHWPKFKFLFPPMGWIMFYSVDDASGYIQVYGVKGKNPQPIDPHEIFRTRTFGYDNIHRGILNTAGYQDNAYRFCKFLRFRFPYFDTFIVSYVLFPERSKNHFNRTETILYQCPIE